jgi:hypothetical protein
MEFGGSWLGFSLRLALASFIRERPRRLVCTLCRLGLDELQCFAELSDLGCRVVPCDVAAAGVPAPHGGI